MDRGNPGGPQCGSRGYAGPGGVGGASDGGGLLLCLCVCVCVCVCVSVCECVYVALVAPQIQWPPGAIAAPGPRATIGLEPALFRAAVAECKKSCNRRGTMPMCLPWIPGLPCYWCYDLGLSLNSYAHTTFDCKSRFNKWAYASLGDQSTLRAFCYLRLLQRYYRRRISLRIHNARVSRLSTFLYEYLLGKVTCKAVVSLVATYLVLPRPRPRIAWPYYPVRQLANLNNYNMTFELVQFGERTSERVIRILKDHDGGRGFADSIGIHTAHAVVLTGSRSIRDEVTCALSRARCDYRVVTGLHEYLHRSNDLLLGGPESCVLCDANGRYGKSCRCRKPCFDHTGTRYIGQCMCFRSRHFCLVSHEAAYHIAENCVHKCVRVNPLVIVIAYPGSGAMEDYAEFHRHKLFSHHSVGQFGKCIFLYQADLDGKSDNPEASYSRFNRSVIDCIKTMHPPNETALFTGFDLLDACTEAMVRTNCEGQEMQQW